jgi:hypothetical protein
VSGRRVECAEFKKKLNNMAKLNSHPSKWGSRKPTYTAWWNSLTDNQKNQYKNLFVEIRKWNATKNKRNPYPDMPNVEPLRLSQLSDRHIYRIWVFRNFYRDAKGDFIRDYSKEYP